MYKFEMQEFIIQYDTNAQFLINQRKTFLQFYHRVYIKSNECADNH